MFASRVNFSLNYNMEDNSREVGNNGICKYVILKINEGVHILGP